MKTKIEKIFTSMPLGSKQLHGRKKQFDKTTGVQNKLTTTTIYAKHH